MKVNLKTAQADMGSVKESTSPGKRVTERVAKAFVLALAEEMDAGASFEETVSEAPLLIGRLLYSVTQSLALSQGKGATLEQAEEICEEAQGVCGQIMASIQAEAIPTLH